tara:strand:- start:266 stop:493 length:228 start_codon:yes stop_codon:yes gene_type:complete
MLTALHFVLSRAVSMAPSATTFRHSVNSTHDSAVTLHRGKGNVAVSFLHRAGVHPGDPQHCVRKSNDVQCEAALS